MKEAGVVLFETVPVEGQRRELRSQTKVRSTLLFASIGVLVLGLVEAL